MATIKSFTSLEQSRKLAGILPLETADMWYVNGEGKPLSGYWNEASHDYDDIPCWSLAALLEQIPYEVCDDDGNSMYLQMNKEDDIYQLVYEDPHGDFESIETDRYEHFVDACYEVIIKLYELKML